MQNISNYEKIKENTYNFYKKIGRIQCPALNNEFVHFTPEGFNHIVYKRKRKERKKEDQIMKFKLIPNAKYIIGLSTTYQEYDESLTEIDKKKFKKRVKETVVVCCWGFIAVIKNYRIKVIIRQVGNGQKHFWSVIPAWTTNQYRGIKLIRKSKGNLNED
ncbi:MAG: hypothetical protein ABH956_01580 [Candidatus Nealsonbacteria bacterium]